MDQTISLRTFTLAQIQSLFPDVFERLCAAFARDVGSQFDAPELRRAHERIVSALRKAERHSDSDDEWHGVFLMLWTSTGYYADEAFSDSVAQVAARQGTASEAVEAVGDAFERLFAHELEADTSAEAFEANTTPDERFLANGTPIAPLADSAIA